MARSTICLMLLVALLAAAAGADAKCGTRQYHEAGDDSCKSCTSKGSRFSKVVGGKRCYKQEASAGRTQCGPTTLPTKIRGNADKKNLIKCLNPLSKEHTIILPLSAPTLPGLNAKHYISNNNLKAMRLGPLKVKVTSGGRTVYTIKTIGNTKGVAVTFSDPTGKALRKMSGKKISLEGVVDDPRNASVDLCVHMTPTVCKVEDDSVKGHHFSPPGAPAEVEDRPKPAGDDNSVSGSSAPTGEDKPKPGDDNPKSESGKTPK